MLKTREPDWLQSVLPLVGRIGCGIMNACYLLHMSILFVICEE